MRTKKKRSSTAAKSSGKNTSNRPAKGKEGKEPELTDDIFEKIIGAIRAGNHIDTAAAYAGINKEVLSLWLEKSLAPDGGIYKRFADALIKAVAEAEVRDVLMITKASEKKYQAAAWKLERSHPEHWRPGESGGTVGTDFSNWKPRGEAFLLGTNAGGKTDAV